MSGALMTVDSVLARALAHLAPVPPERAGLAQSIGCVTADPIVIPAALPARAIALREGYAVSALDLVGASAQSPVMLNALPARVKAGDAMPSGTDAVIETSAIESDGPLVLALESPAPGALCRLNGHDGTAGAMLIRAGTILSHEGAAIAAMAGCSQIAVRHPLIRLEGTENPWLAARITALGCRTGEGNTHLTIRLSEDANPRLALHPGDAAAVDTTNGCVTLVLPARFEALFSAFHALALPCLARLSGQEIRREERPLAAKLSSSLGLGEMALLRGKGGLWHPLAIGHLPLPALALAEAFALIEPASEGHAPGDRLAAIPLASPLGPPENQP